MLTCDWFSGVTASHDVYTMMRTDFTCSLGSGDCRCIEPIVGLAVCRIGLPEAHLPSGVGKMTTFRQVPDRRCLASPCGGTRKATRPNDFCVLHPYLRIQIRTRTGAGPGRFVQRTCGAKGISSSRSLPERGRYPPPVLPSGLPWRLPLFPLESIVISPLKRARTISVEKRSTPC
jgi:hypothetical protein